MGGIVWVLMRFLLVESIGDCEVLGLLRLLRLLHAFHCCLNIEHFGLFIGPNLFEVLDPLMCQLTCLEEKLPTLQLRVDVFAALHARRRLARD